ncbi:MAG: polymer-forming cytoskeletal protein [Verrucomicrobiota bacterium]|nr:polymer-forming cytoskeletal protein [Verrucomicrobiota bacterium]
MFSPNRKNDPIATPAAPIDTPPEPKPAAASNGLAQAERSPTPAPSQAGGLLSSGVSITGSVKFKSELVIDGEVDGEIDSGGRLTVGKNATIRGEIRSKSVIVQGTVEGNIVATERCELQAGCTLRGDIEAPRLIVDEDATFLGSAKIATKPKP